MQSHDFKSSMLNSCTYDETKELLTLTFQKGGQTYEYRDVPEAVYNDFVSAESAGKFFLSQIKGKYTEQKL